MKNVYPFVKKPCDIEKLKNANAYKSFQLLESKGGYKKLSIDEKKTVNESFSELWHGDTYKHGIYKVGGWIINFNEHLKTYLVKFKYYGWMEIKAFNKTCIRKNACFPSYVLEIIEK